MLSIVSIISLDQGKLFPKSKNEDDYFARYLTAADKAEPTVPQKPRIGNFLASVWGGQMAPAPRLDLSD